jgi:DNA-binding MarR family transcriptional regulator|tara:strand:- start:6019 stop:6360 length:342 start_codon:yes stop_codon:yes gene_type:complete
MTTIERKGHTLLRFIEEFRKYQPNIESTAISVFLVVALHDNGKEGIPMQFIADKLNIAQSSVSRNVTKFLRMERNKDTRMGFLESYEDPHERRRKLVRLSKRGWMLFEDISRS